MLYYVMSFYFTMMLYDTIIHMTFNRNPDQLVLYILLSSRWRC